MKRRRIEIYESEIAEYLYNELILEGYAPSRDEAFDIAAIMIDYLYEVGIITEIVEIEGEDE